MLLRLSPGYPQVEGGPNPYTHSVINAYIDSCLFQRPGGNPLFCSPLLSAISRCPLRDVPIETQHGYKIVEVLFQHMRLLFEQTLLLGVRESEILML